MLRTLPRAGLISRPYLSIAGCGNDLEVCNCICLPPLAPAGPGSLQPEGSDGQHRARLGLCIPAQSTALPPFPALPDRSLLMRGPWDAARGSWPSVGCACACPDLQLVCPRWDGGPVPSLSPAAKPREAGVGSGGCLGCSVPAAPNEPSPVPMGWGLAQLWCPLAGGW